MLPPAPHRPSDAPTTDLAKLVATRYIFRWELGTDMLGRMRALVLVVDDGKQHVTLLRLALMQRGYAVVVVTSANSAVTMLRERDVDAFVATGSLETARQIFANLGEARPSVSVAIVEDLERDDAPARALGFESVLRRPVDFGELDAILSSGMQRRASGMRVRARAPRRARRGAA